MLLCLRQKTPGGWTKVELLEDVQFLVRHAGVIMPSNPEEITGLGVESRMLSLQKEMTDARQRYNIVAGCTGFIWLISIICVFVHSKYCCMRASYTCMYCPETITEV